LRVSIAWGVTSPSGADIRVTEPKIDHLYESSVGYGDGPFKIPEKVNDNAYKLNLPPDFGVSPTFNIADLTSYMREEDELELRTIPLQERKDDEDITPMHMVETPPIVIQGPITRARTRQLHQQVSSFLSIRAYSSEDGMLSNDIIDYIVHRNVGDDHEGLGDQQGGPQVNMDAQFNSDLTTSATKRRVH
jgi:hypothetical protein